MFIGLLAEFGFVGCLAESPPEDALAGMESIGLRTWRV